MRNCGHGEEGMIFLSFQRTCNHLIIFTSGASYQMNPTCGCNVTFCTHVLYAPTHWCETDLSPPSPSSATNGSRCTFIHKTYMNIRCWCCQMEQWSWSLPPYRSPLHVTQVVKDIKLWLVGVQHEVCHLIGPGPMCSLPCVFGQYMNLWLPNVTNLISDHFKRHRNTLQSDSSIRRDGVICCSTARNKTDLTDLLDPCSGQASHRNLTSKSSVDWSLSWSLSLTKQVCTNLQRKQHQMSMIR